MDLVLKATAVSRSCPQGFRSNPSTAKHFKATALTVLWQLSIFRLLALTALTTEPRLHQTSVRSGEPTCLSEEKKCHINAKGKVTELHRPRSVRAVCSGIEAALEAQGGGKGNVLEVGKF